MAVLGTVALVFYTFPYLGIIFAPLAVLYWLVASFYRRTSVEARRLDSLMRSGLYASYTESLTGLATIRAYGEQVRNDSPDVLDKFAYANFLRLVLYGMLNMDLTMRTGLTTSRC